MSSYRPPHSKTRASYASFLDKIFGGYGVLLGIVLILVGNMVPLVLKTLLTEVGSILVGVGIIHTAYERVLREHHKEDVLRAVDEVLGPKLRGYANCTAAGITGYYAYLPERVCRIMSRSDDVKMLKTFFQEDRFEEALKKTLRRSSQSKVHIFLSDPESASLKTRSVSLMGYESYGGELVIQEVTKLRELARPNVGRVAVTIYTGWPGAPLILCDDRIYLGIYLRQARSFRSPWVEIDATSKIGQVLAAQFDTFDQDSTTLTTMEDFDRWINKHPLPACVPKDKDAA